jgi:hypothetical protein
MAMRRNPQRTCQEMMMPPSAAFKLQPIVIEAKEASHSTRERQPLSQRRTKRATANSQRRKRRISLPQIHRPANNVPFPFFQLPRELRDQVYSSLVTRTDGGRSIISAVSLLNDKKARRATQVKRERLNRKRILDGKPPVRIRDLEPEMVVHLNLLQASRRLCDEARDCLYNSNWFAITLDKLPHTTFETPYGWNLSKITRLQLEVQIKDAAHMNSYVDWTTFFSALTSLRFLHIAPTFHPRYYDWASSELSSWTTAHYIHKAFFRELLAGVPSHVDVKLGTLIIEGTDLQLQGTPVSQRVIADMYSELSAR